MRRLLFASLYHRAKAREHHGGKRSRQVRNDRQSQVSRSLRDSDSRHVIWLLFSVLAAQSAQAANFSVNSTADASDADTTDGLCDTNLTTAGDQCTFRAALEQANASSRADTIGFDIPDSDPRHDPTTGLFTISPTRELPLITDTVTIDGYTQPGASPNTPAVGTDAKLLIKVSGALFGGNNALIELKTSDSFVRGLVIADSRLAGIDTAQGARRSGNRVTGNMIVNNLFGVLARGSNNVVGGTSPAARNVISKNKYGVVLGGTNKVYGSYIGTDPSGTQDWGNQYGVSVSHATLGGTTPGEGNLISGNVRGVYIHTPTWPEFAGDAKVQGNLIGTQANGTGTLGNAFAGVFIFRSSDNTMGGTTAGAKNTIAFNYGCGVCITSVGHDSEGNRIWRNSIFSNDGEGIALGATVNDPKDPDIGSNRLQNWPFIVSAAPNTIKGKLNSTPNRTYLLQFFFNPPGGDEGKHFIGQMKVTTNAKGNVTFTFKPNQRVPVGWAVTATATDHGGNTSEFSRPREVTRPYIV